MTNILVGLMLTFTTNRVGVYSLPDGGHLCEYAVLANVECNHTTQDGVIQFTAQSFYSKFSQIEPPAPPPPLPLLPPPPLVPAPPPFPNRSSAITTPALPFVAASGMPFSLLPPRFANGGPDEENASQMFRVDFMTETNRIYALEASRDFVHWEPRLPEIDGTGQPEFFFDANNAGESYRVMSRVGTLPQ